MPIEATPIVCLGCARRSVMDGADLPLEWVEIRIRRTIPVSKKIVNPDNPEEGIELIGEGSQEHTDVFCPDCKDLPSVRLELPDWSEIEIDDGDDGEDDE